MTSQQYNTGNAYVIVNKCCMIFDDISEPELGPSNEEFHAGYMWGQALIFPRPTNLICLQVFSNYLQFLWGEKTIWIFKLDADACLRPLFSGCNQKE